MNNILTAVVLTAILQVVCVSGLVTYLYQSNDNTAQRYALMAENNAVAKSRESIQRMYNTLQTERNTDRDELHAWTLHQIDLQIAKNKVSASEVHQ